MAAPTGGDKPVGPRSSKGARTRARLLDAAKAVFEESGFLDARVSDITERAELSQGSFYHYFDSKEEIFREVAETQEERLSVHSIIDSGLVQRVPEMTIRERLHRSNRVFLSDYRDEARIMGVIEEVSRYDEQVGAARFARQRIYIEQTARSISELQRAGHADAGLDPLIAAWALTSMMGRFAELWFVEGRIEVDFDDAVEQATIMCANALGVTEGP